MKTSLEKYELVIEKNTFYFFDNEFEEQYEHYIFSLKETIIYLRGLVLNEGCTKSVFDRFLRQKGINGLKALLAITGISNESLKRLITTIRILNKPDLNKLLYRDKWDEEQLNNDICEWNTGKIYKLLRENEYFRKFLVNLFFEGSTNGYICELLPTFELKKFSLEKLSFDNNAMIDTLARYKEKGSRSAKRGNNPEELIRSLLKKLNVSFIQGDLNELVKNESIRKRTMDFIIPSKENPRIIIESSFLTTTSSGQGDKSKTEIEVNRLIKKYYPKSKFIGFVDGIGWYVRKNDLKRMVTAYEEVFTYREDEIERFSRYLLKELDNE